MAEYWQHLVILVVLMGAIAFLIHRLVNWRRRRKACSECELFRAGPGTPRQSR